LAACHSVRSTIFSALLRAIHIPSTSHFFPPLFRTSCPNCSLFPHLRPNPSSTMYPPNVHTLAILHAATKYDSVAQNTHKKKVKKLPLERSWRAHCMQSTCDLSDTSE
jgi:hypothetical protein